VRDSGVGIDPSRLDQIFPPFVTRKLEETEIGYRSAGRSSKLTREQLSACGMRAPAHTVFFSGWETLK
jgi:hypothetical protein